MSYPCNKYEQIMPSYLLSVNYFEDKGNLHNKESFPVNKGSFSALGLAFRILRSSTYL